MGDQVQDLGYNPLLQRFFLSPEEKANKEKGKLILKQFYSQQTSNDSNLNFYKARNARYVMLLLWAKGSQPMQEFLDYMNVSDGNKAWVNIDTTPQRLGTQFVTTLVESMSKNKTYPCVEAIDDGSMNEKENRMFEALFRMKEIETINQFQQDSGVQLEPSDVYVPDDELSAKVYFKLEDRLPKEIRFEEMLGIVRDAIKFDRIVNRKTIYDLTVLNLAATRIEKLGAKQYTARKCVPTNMVYNFFMNDNGEVEITMIGEFYNLKVKDYRKRFGKTPERPDGLTEKEIYELAKLSTNKNIGTFNYMWNDTYSLTTFNGNRPYDDSSILVLDCSINCESESYYVNKKDSFGKDNIQIKKSVPYQQKTKDGKIIEQDKPENVEIIKKEKKEWMRGVYAPYGDKMLYWGGDDFIINQYTDVSCPLCPYSIQIPNNDGEYVPSLFERIMEPLREYSLVKLKRKQLIAKIRPSGVRIDVESARNIDLGTGDTIPWEEVVRIFDQTGNEIWSSKGLDALQKESPPIANTVQDVTVQKIIELSNVLEGIRSEIRQLIGVPQYRDGSDVGERTSGVLQEQQEAASYNVTDFILNSNNQLWEETFYKLCLLHWNDVVKEEPESKEDLLNTRFKVTVKMKSTDYERVQLEKDIAMYSQVPDVMGNPSVTLKDAMFIREIDDSKLARWYLSKTYEENRRNAAKEKQADIEANAKLQQESNDQAAQKAIKLQEDKIKAEKDMEMFKGSQAKELASVTGLWAAIGKGVISPEVAMPVIQQLMPNITMPLSMENKLLARTAAMQESISEQTEEIVNGQPQEEAAEQPMVQ